MQRGLNIHHDGGNDVTGRWLSLGVGSGQVTTAAAASKPAANTCAPGEKATHVFIKRAGA
ncbi:MAG: hypothetical protein WDO69_09080 [Pseudomonadota bacterium]